MYEYHYFGYRGIRGRHIRTLLRDQHIPFKEFCHDHDNWAAFKATVPCGSLPLMRDGDFTIYQSNAILRHLARKHDLYGEGIQEAAMIDMLNDGVEDMRVKYVMSYLTHQTPSPKDGDTAKVEYLKTFPNTLQMFEKLLAENDGGSGFLVGKKISYVDYNLFDILETHIEILDVDLKDYPLLKSFHERMAKRPVISACRQLKSWVAPYCTDRTFWV